MLRRLIAPLLVSLVAGLLPLLAPAAPAAAAVTHVVEVVDNAFVPAVLHIAPGDSVQWVWRGATSHTVTAADGSFDSGQQATGSFTVAFGTTPARYDYLCKVHEAMGMTGVIVVGDPPAAPELTGTVFVPSDGIPVHEAVQRAAPGTTVVLEPGTHELREPLRLARPGVTVQGGRRAKKGKDAIAPVDPAQVRVSSPGAVPYAFVVTARGSSLAHRPVTTVADLTVTGFRLGAVAVEGADGFVVRRVVAEGAGWDHGVLARGSSRGIVDSVHVTGARYAGISLQACSPCDIAVLRATVTGSFTGIELAGGAHGVEVAGSTLSGNAAGVVAYAREGVQAAQGVVIRDNTVSAPSSSVPMPTVFQPENLPPGAGPGIWLAGARDAWVLRNTVIEHRYGVVLTARGAATERVTVESNVVDRSVRADLGWDGVGRDVCFTGNSTTAGGTPTSSPNDVHALYPCSRPTVGLPNPVLSADLTLDAWQTYGQAALEE